MFIAHRLPFGLRASRALLTALFWASVSAPMAAQTPPPFYFIVDGNIANGDQFDPGFPYHFDTGNGGSGSVSRPVRFGSVSVAATIGPAGLSTGFQGEMRPVHASKVCNLVYGCGYALSAGTTLFSTIGVYVRGAPGTRYHVDQADTGQLAASVIETHACASGYGNATASAFWSGRADTTPRATTEQGPSDYCGRPAPKSGTAAVSLNTTEDGLTTAPTLTHLGQIYSFAYWARTSLNLDIGANQDPDFTATSTGTVNVRIAGYIVRPLQRPPLARLVVPLTVAADTPVLLDGSQSSDPDGSILEYRWEIQNSTGGTDVFRGPRFPYEQLSYTWTASGSYPVRLTVTDNDGQTGSASAAVYVNPSSLVQFDVDRDGRVSFTAADDASETHPFRFWLNNDLDGDVEDLATVERVDAGDGRIANLRDLEDFAMLAIRVPDGVDLAAPGTRVVLTLEPRSGAPELNLFRAAVDDNAYLYDTTAGLQQLSLGQVSRRVNSGEADVPLTLFSANRTSRFLVEGVTQGCGVLTAKVLLGTSTASTGQTYVCFHDFRDFYDHTTAGTFEADPSLGIPGLTLRPAQLHFAVQPLLDQATCDYITFVHGWRLRDWERVAFAETAFKRLWQLGYRGRFAFFSWPTGWIAADSLGDYIARLLWPFGAQANYVASEYLAWTAGAELRTMLGKQRAECNGEAQVRVLAHSMGNVVTSEALRLEAESGTPRILAQAYVATQAVTPAGAYDSFSGTALDSYSRYPPTARPYFDSIGSAASNIINYYNRDDLVLNFLGTHNGLKPLFNSPLFPGGCYFSLLFRALVFPSDTHWIYSVCARAASDPMGLTSQVDGAISRSFDLGRAFSFGSVRNDHSAQFLDSMHTRAPYWKQLLVDFALPGSNQTTCLPNAPTAVRASVAGNIVRVAWTPPTGQLRGHLVDVGSRAGLADLTTIPVGAPASSLFGTAPSGRYFVRVSAVSQCGTGPASGDVIVEVPSACTVPAAPGPVTHTVAGAIVTLNWTHAGNAFSYVVEAGSSPGLSNLTTTDVGFVTTLSASPPSAVYYVRVRGVSACGAVGPASNEAVVTIP